LLPKKVKKNTGAHDVKTNAVQKKKRNLIEIESNKDVKSISRLSEKRFLKNDIRFIIGIDEAGRGPLAGPVVAAACIVDERVVVDGIMDSKITKEADRERIYEELTTNPLVRWAACRVEHSEIDEVNILQASLNAMRRAVQALLSQFPDVNPTECIALVDGNRVPTDMPVASEYVIKGDGSVYSIAAASIIAKVTRDRVMVQYSAVYPQYGLAQHKGYPTAAHVAALHRHGPCPIHRLSFAPVRKYAGVEKAKVPKPQVEVSTSEDARTLVPKTRKRPRAGAATEPAPVAEEKAARTASSGRGRARRSKG